MAKPWLTIQHAIDSAPESGWMPVAIQIAAGTYQENLVLWRPLSLDGGWSEDFMDQWDHRGLGTVADPEHETVIDGGGEGPCIPTESPYGGLSISGLTIQNGRAETGGGILCRFDSSMTISHSTLRNNTATYGGGIYCGYSSFLHIQNCDVNGNTAQYGAGVFLDEDGGAQLENTLLRGNGAEVAGGAIFHGYGSYSLIENCTIAGNGTTSGGAIFFSEESCGNIRNAILWGNTAAIAPEIRQGTGSYVIVSHSDIDQPDFLGSDGNIREDPLFLGEDGFRLTPNSPCIDSGNDDVVLPHLDLEGNGRRLDGDGDGRPMVDMGAYEFAFHPCQADLAFFTLAFGGSGCP